MTEGASPKIVILTEQAVASRYFVGVARALQERGAEVVVVTIHPEGPLHQDLRGSGATGLSLGAATRSLYPIAATRLKKLLARLHPSFIISAHEVLPTATAVLARRLGVRNQVVFHRHHTVGGRSLRVLSRWVAQRSDLVVAVSAASARCALRDDEVERRMLRTALNGIDAPSPREVKTVDKGSGPLIVGVGRLRREKGFDDLIRAMAILQMDLVSSSLVLVGDGPERSSLETLARALEVECRFVGWADDPFPYLRAADVVAIPSTREPFGLVTIEAMAMGRPVVASSVGGLPEIVVDGRTGRLTDAANPPALAATLKEILGDASLALYLGTEARQLYESRFTASAMAERWLDSFGALTASDR